MYACFPQLELKKRTDKEDAEKRKRENEERERQKESKRLNYLLSQTQLYSHFMAQKLGYRPDGDHADEGVPVPPMDVDLDGEEADG